MNMLIWAIQNAGLNRAKIRDLIAYRMEPWQGVTGEIRFSPVLDDVGEVYLARRENGKWKYSTREEMGVPRTAAQGSSTDARGRPCSAWPWPCLHLPPLLPGADSPRRRRCALPGPFAISASRRRPTPGPGREHATA